MSSVQSLSVQSLRISETLQFSLSPACSVSVPLSSVSPDFSDPSVQSQSLPVQFSPSQFSPSPSQFSPSSSQFSPSPSQFSRTPLLQDPKYPKISPARFARRIASFSYVLLLLDHKYPEFSRRASCAGMCLCPLCSTWFPYGFLSFYLVFVSLFARFRQPGA